LKLSTEDIEKNIIGHTIDGGGGTTHIGMMAMIITTAMMMAMATRLFIHHQKFHPALG
jgi:hypothetical protein